MWRHMTGAERILEVLLTRRSVSPRRLQQPGPNPDELDGILQAGLRAPDHGGLHPWRVIEFRPQNREALAWCFEQEKLRRDPLASPADLKRAREHATRPPLLLGFVVSPRERSKIPGFCGFTSIGKKRTRVVPAVEALLGLVWDKVAGI